MSRIKKIGVFLLSICMLGMFIPSSVYAASAKVSVSSASGNVGSTVTINCTASISGASIGSADVTLKYPDSSLSVVNCSSGASGSAGSVYFSQFATSDGQSSLSFSVTFQVLKEGTFDISVTNYDVSDWETETSIPATISNGTITGKAVTTNNNTGNSGGGTGNSGNTGNNNQQDTRDKNSKLSSLQVSPGTLAPAFHAGTTSYTVTVPADTTEVTIAATAQSSKAAVSVSGGKDIKLGENQAKVVVTAENGSTSVYNLTIICGEKETISINGVNNTINEEFTDDQVPAGFVREKITYNGRQYEALKHEKSGLQLLSLQNEAGAVFYIYNQETQEFYHFVQVQFSEGKYIIPLPLNETEEFAENELTVLTVQDKTFDAWKIDEEYSVLLAMNADGEEVLYQYDSVDGTFQRYAGPVEEEAEEVVEEIEEKTFLEEHYLFIIIGLGALAGILTITLIYFIATRKHRHQARKRKMQKKLEKQLEKELTDEFEK